MHGTLAQMTQHQQQMVQQMTQATNQAGQPRIKTLQETNPHLLGNALKLCERHELGQCPEFWQQLHTVAKGGDLAYLLLLLGKNGATHNAVDAPFAADLRLSRWIANDPTKLTEGLSFTRLHTYLTPTADQNRRDVSNRTYQLLGTVDTSTPRMTELVIAESKANIPTTAAMLRAQVKSLNILLATLAGVHTQHTTAFREQLHDKMDDIEMLIVRDYADQEKMVCLIITLWIVRTMRHALIELMDGPVPTADTPRPVTHSPPYGEVYAALVQGNILRLQDVPSSLVEQQCLVPAPAPAPAPAIVQPRGQPPPGPPPGPRGEAPAINNQRAPVRLPNQNPRLKQAWIRGGDANRSIYSRPGDPFYDANRPPSHKVVIMRLSGNTQQRICLPMACKGVCTSNCTGSHAELTPAEEEAVARAANPPSISEG